MRYLSKLFVVAVGLLSIGILSSSVSAKDVLVGSFTLAHPTKWKNTLLSAGEYRFKLARTQTDTNLLSIHGSKDALDILVFAQSACETCRDGALKVDVQGDTRVVTSLDLPGYHLDFKGNRSASESREQLAKAPVSSEQVAVHVNSN